MRRFGFTLVDLLLLVIALGIIGVLLLAFTHRARMTSRTPKDQSNTRGIAQGMTLLAQNNMGLMPLPSERDVTGDTVAGPADAKDTSANIISMLIYDGFVSPEHCVSPAESNQRIRIDDNYLYSEPTTAANPAKALWDPAFSADFTHPAAAGTAAPTANLSYAIRPSWSNARRPRFDTMDTNIAIVGNRGPEISRVTYDAKGTPTATRASLTSNTNLIHGGRNTWEGYIAYGDNSVVFETIIAPERLTFSNAQGTNPGTPLGDVLFYDEASDMTDTNNYLGIFTATGSTRGEWKAIWD